MFVHTITGDGPIKYRSDRIEVNPDGVSVDGIMYRCTHKESSLKRFDVYVSIDDFKKIILHSGESIPITNSIEEKFVYSTFFEDLTKNWVRKTNSVKYPGHIFWFDDRKLACVYTTNRIECEDWVLNRIQKYFLVDDIKSNIKKYLGKVLGLMDIDWFVPKISEYNNVENHDFPYNEIENNTDMKTGYDEFFSEMVKGWVKKIDNFVYPDKIFWFKRKVLMVVFDGNQKKIVYHGDDILSDTQNNFRIFDYIACREIVTKNLGTALGLDGIGWVVPRISDYKNVENHIFQKYTTIKAVELNKDYVTIFENLVSGWDKKVDVDVYPGKTFWFNGKKIMACLRLDLDGIFWLELNSDFYTLIVPKKLNVPITDVNLRIVNDITKKYIGNALGIDVLSSNITKGIHLFNGVDTYVKITDHFFPKLTIEISDADILQIITDMVSKWERKVDNAKYPKKSFWFKDQKLMAVVTVDSWLEYDPCIKDEIVGKLNNDVKLANGAIVDYLPRVLGVDGKINGITYNTYDTYNFSKITDHFFPKPTTKMIDADILSIFTDMVSKWERKVDNEKYPKKTFWFEKQVVMAVSSENSWLENSWLEYTHLVVPKLTKKINGSPDNIHKKIKKYLPEVLKIDKKYEEVVYYFNSYTRIPEHFYPKNKTSMLTQEEKDMGVAIIKPKKDSKDPYREFFQEMISTWTLKDGGKQFSDSIFWFDHNRELVALFARASGELTYRYSILEKMMDTFKSKIFVLDIDKIVGNYMSEFFGIKVVKCITDPGNKGLAGRVWTSELFFKDTEKVTNVEGNLELVSEKDDEYFKNWLSKLKVVTLYDVFPNMIFWVYGNDIFLAIEKNESSTTVYLTEFGSNWHISERLQYYLISSMEKPGDGIGKFVGLLKKYYLELGIIYKSEIKVVFRSEKETMEQKVKLGMETGHVPENEFEKKSRELFVEITNPLERVFLKERFPTKTFWVGDNGKTIYIVYDESLNTIVFNRTMIWEKIKTELKIESDTMVKEMLSKMVLKYFMISPKDIFPLGDEYRMGMEAEFIKYNENQKNKLISEEDDKYFRNWVSTLEMKVDLHSYPDEIFWFYNELLVLRIVYKNGYTHVFFSNIDNDDIINIWKHFTVIHPAVYREMLIALLGKYHTELGIKGPDNINPCFINENANTKLLEKYFLTVNMEDTSNLYQVNTYDSIKAITNTVDRIKIIQKLSDTKNPPNFLYKFYHELNAINAGFSVLNDDISDPIIQKRMEGLYENSIFIASIISDLEEVSDKGTIYYVMDGKVYLSYHTSSMHLIISVMFQDRLVHKKIGNLALYSKLFYDETDYKVTSVSIQINPHIFDEIEKRYKPVVLEHTYDSIWAIEDIDRRLSLIKELSNKPNPPKFLEKFIVERIAINNYGGGPRDRYEALVYIGKVIEESKKVTIDEYPNKIFYIHDDRVMLEHDDTAVIKVWVSRIFNEMVWEKFPKLNKIFIITPEVILAFMGIEVSGIFIDRNNGSYYTEIEEKIKNKPELICT